MKILILQHTLWIEMLAECWRGLKNLEIAVFQLPVISWEKNPAAKFESARLLLETLKHEKADFILDVNGAGIIPLDESHESWTSESFPVPCVEWWWDDPNNNSPLFYGHHYDKWFKALTAPSVRHFFWDETLAEEYSVWFGRKCRYLPTAVHPGAFNPEAEKLSRGKTACREISFLGSCYGHPCLGGEKLDEMNYLSGIRLASPCENYFEMMKKYREKMPAFTEIIEKSMKSPAGIFLDEMHWWRNHLNYITGIKRRREPLAEIAGLFKSRLIVGKGFPASFGASTDTFFQPLELCACYRSSFFNLDLGNAQSFTGTNMRSYEIMSCAALLARNEKPDFDPDSSLEKRVYLRFSSAGELHELHREYGADKKKYDEICANARQYVLEKHTWLNRLAEIISALSEKSR